MSDDPLRIRPRALIRLEGQHGQVFVLEFMHESLGGIGPGMVGEGDLGAEFRQQTNGGLADTPAAAGDQDARSMEVGKKGHGYSRKRDAIRRRCSVCEGGE